MFGKRRIVALAATFTLIGAILALGAGMTFGLFSSNLGLLPQGVFNAGTVTLNQTNPEATVNCTVNTVAPGDSGNACTMAVDYTGSLPAYIGVQLVGGGYLYNHENMQFGVIDPNNAGWASMTYEPTSATSPSVIFDGPATPGTPTPQTTDLTIGYSLPTSADNNGQGQQGTVTVTVFAVQQAHNNLPAAGCAPGVFCAGPWS